MKGLEALKVVEKDCEDLEQVPYGEFALIEKSLKALEIIKEKNVDVLAIKESKTLEEYNSNAWEVEHYGRYKGYKLQLTQEEFNLLKEVLE